MKISENMKASDSYKTQVIPKKTGSEKCILLITI